MALHQAFPPEQLALARKYVDLTNRANMFEAILAPELGGRLHFAGEHTSVDFLGYMNGAVESGERVADEILG